MKHGERQTRLNRSGSGLSFGTWRFGLEHEDSGVLETDREDAHELLAAL
jgi:hypothetical protein